MAVIYLIVAVMIPIIPLIASRARPYAPAGGPLAIISLQLFLGVTIKTVYTYFFISEMYAFHLTRSEEFFQFALLYMICFSVTLSAGYLLASRSGERYSAHDIIREQYLDRTTCILLMVACIIVFVIVFSLLMERRESLTGFAQLLSFEGLHELNRSKVQSIVGQSEFGATHAYIVSFLAIVFLGFIIFFANMLIRPERKIYLVGVYLTLAILFAEILTRGKRNNLAEIMIAIVLLVYFIRGRIKPTDAMEIIKYVAAAIFVFSIISFLRGNQEAGVTLEGVDLADNLLTPILGSTYFTDINILATIMEQMQFREYHYGESFSRFVTGLIPREFWPDKPAISLGLFVKSELLGRPGSLGGIPPTLPGESFINFGWFGMAVALVYGMMLRRFEVILLSAHNIRRYGSFWIYIFLVIPLTWSLLQSSFAVVITGVIAKGGLGLLISIYVAGAVRRHWRQRLA